MMKTKKRGEYLTTENIRELLKEHLIMFVIADIGLKLTWISSDKSFDFWKTEVKPHLAEEINHINLDNFPDNYAYVASEWSEETKGSIILLEKYH